MPTWETWFNADDIRDASEELHCYAISERSLKICLALLDHVNYGYRYDGAVTDDEIDGWQADLAFQLMGESEDCAPVIEPDDPCIEYPPETLFIEYAPNDPFQTPDTIPDGYFVPPWYTNPGIPLPGVLPGDAMVNFLSIAIFADLPDIVAVGLPRFRITVEGEGEVEIEFVKVPQGGNVLVVIDGNPLEQQVFDLNSLPIGDLSVIEELFDIIVGEALVSTEICEVDFTTPGIHTIDVTFLPNIATDVILGFGGGVRRVSLCGLSAEGVDTNMPQFQVVDCVLQWRPNDGAVWSDLVDLCAVQPPTIVRQDITPPGNMQQDIGGAGYTDIANTDFVWRDGQYPMIGGLEIYPTADQVLLTMKGAVNPYQAAKIMVVQDGAGVDRAWINPRGDIHVNGDASGVALVLETGSQFMNNNERINWKRSTDGVYRPGIWSETNVIKFQSTGSGLHWRNNLGILVGSFSEDGVYKLKNDSAGAAGVTQMQIQSGAGQAANPLLVVRNAAGDFLQANYDSGQLNQMTVDAAAGVSDNLTLEHRIATTPVAGFGAGMTIKGKSSTTNAQSMARLYAAWETATHATRKADLVIEVSDYAGQREAVRYRASGAAAMIGEYGHAPAAQQIVVGDTYGIPALDSLLGALAATGRIVNSTTSVAETPWAVLENLPFVVVDERNKNPALQSLLELGQDAGLWVNSTTEGECCEDFPIFWCKVYDFTVEGDRLGWSLQQGFEGTGGFWNDEAVSQTVFVQREESANFKIYELSIDYEYTGSGDFNLYIGGFDFTDPAIYSVINQPAGTGTLVIDLSPGETFPGGFRIVGIANDTGETLFIHGMTITGFDQGLYDTMGDGNECPPEP